MIGDITYKIIVREDYMQGNFGIYYFRESPTGRHMLYQDGNSYKEVLIEKGVASAIPPSLNISRDLLQQLLVEITNLGVELPTKSKVEGLYEAQSFHLHDLRYLLNLDIRETNKICLECTPRKETTLKTDNNGNCLACGRNINKFRG